MGDHLYRYVLRIPFKNGTIRSEPHRIVTIVMMNPSCCTPDKCDQTTKRALRYVLRYSEELGGADNVITVNLYAYQQTDSSTLAHLLNEGAPSVQIVGPHSDHYIRHAAERSSIVIAAWGEPRGLRKEGHKSTPAGYARSRDRYPARQYTVLARVRMDFHAAS